MKSRLLFTLLLGSGLAFISGCANVIIPTEVPEVRPGFVVGYLPHKDLPDSIALLPLPPAAGSAAFALDEEANSKILALRGTPRWALAISDANIMFPHAADTFSCALSAAITQQNTPHLYMLLRRTMMDAGDSTYDAKRKYRRTRPFVVNKHSTCTPTEEEIFKTDGSYPAGQSAIGWAWALVLTEISPEQSGAILARGWSFGQSRAICNAHWQSDVTEGRVMGAATVARLHADTVFRAELEAAKVELAAVRSQGLKPVRDCKVEAEALAH
jgi:acid phosphatase (class A)